MKGRLLEESRVKYYVERQSFFARAAVTLMLLSAVFRLIGCWGLWGDPYFAATQIALPLACCLVFVLFLLLLGKRLFAATSLPVLLGVVFFIIKSFTFDSWVHTVLCILLYLLVAVLYTATAFGYVHTKWLLVPLFGLPFLYHIFVEDLAALRNTENPLSFSAGMQEMSVLCVMLALLCTALAMKKKKTEKAEEEAADEPQKNARFARLWKKDGASEPEPEPADEAPAAAPWEEPEILPAEEDGAAEERPEEAP